MKHRHKHIKHKIKSFKPRKLIFQRLGFWITLLALAFICSIIYIVFFFPKFQVTTVSVSGNQTVTTNTIENTVWHNIQKNIMGISYKSIFTINTQALANSLISTFPQIAKADVQHQWLGGLSISISERHPVADFCPSQALDNCFTIDNNGVIYQKLENTTGASFTIEKDVNELSLKLGQTVVDKSIMDSILKIEDNLKNNAPVDIKEVLVADTLVITTSEGWKVYFDPTTNIDLQITKMNALLKDQLPQGSRKNLQYIYLQYSDRAYYK